MIPKELILSVEIDQCLSFFIYPLLFLGLKTLQYFFLDSNIIMKYLQFHDCMGKYKASSPPPTY